MTLYGEAKRLADQRYVEKNRDKRLASQRNVWLKRRYGITVERYEEMLVEQDGVCVISGRAPESRRLDVDHDHETGKVRALLHHRINKAIGLVGEDPEMFEKIAEYLRHHKELHNGT